MEIEDRSAVLGQLARIVASPGFAGAPKLQKFLTFVTEQTLAGRVDQIKESVIGSEVYQKPLAYDPRMDATVRVEAAKLRQRLQQYYDAHPGDPVRILIPKGSYVAQFEEVVAETAATQPAAVPPDEPAPMPPLPGVASSRPRGRISKTTVGIAAALAAATLVWVYLPPAPGPSPSLLPRLRQLTELGEYADEPAISRDGTFVVYCSDSNTPGITNLWRLELATGTATQLTRLHSSARTPSLSADGKTLAFRLDESGGLLATMPAAGGEVRRLPATARGRDPSLDPSGSWLAFWVPQDEQTLDNGGVFIADLTAGATSTPTRVFGSFVHALRPVWDETGRYLAVLGTWQSMVPAREHDLWTARVDSGQLAQTPEKTGLLPLLQARGVYSTIGERSRVATGDWRGGRLYFSAPNGDGVSLYRVGLNAARTVTGELELLSAGAGRQINVRSGSPQRLVFASALTSYDLHSIPLTESTEPPVRFAAGPGLNIRFSLDRLGRLAVWERRLSHAPGRIWLEDLAARRGRDLGSGFTDKSYALLSPDGRRVAYQVLQNGRAAIYVEPATVSGAAPPPLAVCQDCGAPADWAAGGTHLAYVTGERPSTIGMLEVATGRQSKIAAHPSYGLFGPRLDVDAKGDGWMLLYADNGPRTRQIFVAPVRSFRPLPPQQWISVTDGAQWDRSPAWGPGGRSVYYVSDRDGHRCIWQQELTPGDRRPAGEAVAVRHFQSPAQTLMRSVSNRGVEALWVAGGRLYFSLESTSSSIWLRE